MLVPDVDTYVEVVEADAYFDKLYGYDKWTDLDETTKEQLLRSAVQRLDLLCSWFGDLCATDQPLAFPRTPDCTTPQGVKDAQCEIAYLFLDTQTTKPTEENPLKKMKAGGVEMEWFDRLPAINPLESGIVVDLLRPFGLCPGAGATKMVPIFRA